MYRLLIVTDNQKVKDMFSQMEGWEALGFKAPRLRSSVEDAVECMHKHAIDAIAVENDDRFTSLKTYLDEKYPNMPIFQIEQDADRQLQTVRELSGLLSRLRADDSNDEYDDALRFETERIRWGRKLISGLVPSVDQIKRQLLLYRCPERIDVPCVLGRIDLPDDDDFMDERWHYGSERLEIALRNFFGRERDHMLIHVAVVSPEEVRVMCYPVNPEDGITEDAVYEMMQETIEQIENYLGLAMKVTDVRLLDGLSAFASDNSAL